MKKTALIISAFVAVFCFGFFTRTLFARQPDAKAAENRKLVLWQINYAT